MTGASPTEGPLAGVRVAVTGARKGAELAETFRRRGADVVHAPTLAGDVPAATDAIQADIAAMVADPPTLFAASTGMGMRLLADVADAADLLPDLRVAITSGHVAARGAKARGGLGRVGVVPDWTAPNELDREVVDHLLEVADAPTSIVVQVHGAGGHPYARLAVAGHTVRYVRPYVSAPLDDDGPARALVRALLDDDIDVVTFTSPGAVHGLADVATGMGVTDDLRAALGRSDVVVASIGPVTSEAVSDHDWHVDIEPAEHRNGALVRAVVAAVRR